MLLVLKGRQSISEIDKWRDELQSEVNLLEGNDYLQFTCELWNTNTRPTRDNIKMCRNSQHRSSPAPNCILSGITTVS